MSMPVLKGFTNKTVYIQNTKVSIITNNSTTPDKLIIYLHGGGFTFGLLPVFKNIASILSKEANGEVILVDYPLSPEFPYPAALNYSYAIYLWALEQGYHEDSIYFGGDSAGAGLVLSILLKIKVENKPMPKGISLISPWTNLYNDGESFSWNVNRGDILNKDWLDLVANNYARKNDKSDPFISPSYGDYTGFPPVHIQVGSNELLLSDALAFNEKALDLGVRMDFNIIGKASHDHYLYAGLLPSSTGAIINMANYINNLSLDTSCQK